MTFSGKTGKTLAIQASSNPHGLYLTKHISISHKQEELKKIESYDISSTCIDVLNAMLSLTEKDADKFISKIENKQLKQKFLSFKQEYYYQMFRQGKLKFKVSELNDFFKEIATSKELILPTIRLKSDEIKELDYLSLQKVIKMVNQSKIFTQIMKKEEVKLNIDYFHPESLTFFNSLIKMQNENFEDVKTLKVKCDQLQSDLRVLKMKFNQRPSQTQKEQKVSVNFEQESNREIIAKLKADVDRLTKDNQKLNEQITNQSSNYNERLNYRKYPLEDERQKVKKQKQMKALLTREYQQVLAQKQRRIKELTDNSKVTKILLDQAKVERELAKDISKVHQMQFSQLNEKYEKLVKEANERKQKQKEQKLFQYQKDIMNSSEIRRLGQLLQSQEQLLDESLKKLQLRQKSQSEEKIKTNQLIEKEKAALLRYERLKQEKQRNQRTFQEKKQILRKQLEEKSATLQRKEEELKDAKTSLDALQNNHDLVTKQLDRLKDEQSQEKETIRVYQSRISNLESLIKKLESSMKEKEESLNKEKKQSKQLSENIVVLQNGKQLLKKELTRHQARSQKYELLQAQKKQQDEQCNKLRENIKQKKEQITSLNASIRSIKDQSQEAVTRLLAQIKELKDQREQKSNQVTEKEGKISQLFTTVKQLQMKLKQSEEKNKKIEKDIQQINNQNITYLLNIQTIKDQYKNLESKYNVMEKKMKTLQTLRSQQEEKFQILNQQPANEPKYEEKNQQHQQKDLQRQIQQKQAQVQKANEKCRKIEQELQGMQQQCVRQSSKSKQLQSKANDLQKRLQDSEQQLKDKQRVLNDVLQQLDQYKKKQKIRMSKQLADMKQAREKEIIGKSIQGQLEEHKKLLAMKNEELRQQSLSHLKEKEEIKQQLDKVKGQNEELVEKIAQIQRENPSLEAKRTEDQLNREEEQRKQKESLQAQIINCQKKYQEKEQLLRFKDEQLEKLYKEQEETNITLQEYKQKQSQISTANAQIADLTLKIQKVQAENEKLALNLKQSESESNIKRIKINQLLYDNDNYQATFRKMNDELDNSKRHIKDIIQEQQNALDKERKKHSLEMQKVNDQLDLLTKKNKELQELFEKLTQSNERLESQLAKKEGQLEAQKSASSKLRHEIAQFYLEKKKPALSSDERTKFQKKLKKYEEQIDDLNHQIQVLNQALQDMNSMNQSFDIKSEIHEDSKESSQKIRMLEQKIAQNDEYVKRQQAKWKQEKHMLDVKISERNAQIDALEEKNKDLEASYQGLAQELQATKLEMTKISKALDLKTKEFSMLQQSHDLLIKQQRDYIKQMENERQTYERQLNKVKKHCHDLLKQKDLTANLLFQNDILQYEFQYKTFLKHAIQDHMRLTIYKSRLIYRFDPMNKTNFHKYFDQKDNIVIIIKTIYGSYIAGYSQGSFAPKKVSDRDGLIISLNKKEVFTLNENCSRAITYDDYYLIFGNSEIRVRSQQQKIFSNFAISNGYYATRGKRVMDLLGGSPSEREVDIEGYEIYQLEFVF